MPRLFAMSVGVLPDVRASFTASSLNSLAKNLLCPMISSPSVYHGLNYLPFATGEDQDKITDKKNIKWLNLSLFIGIPIWFFIIIFGGVMDGIYHYQGGFYWQSFAYALWESLTAIGFSTGIIAFFKKKANINNKFTKLIKDNAFGMYFFHPPVIIIISLVFRRIALVPVVKFAVVTVITSMVCLIFTFAVRKIKPIGILLK